MPSTPLQWLAPTLAISTASDENYSSITQLANGNIVVAFTTDSAAAPSDPNGTDILIRIFNPLGQVVGDPIRINTFRAGDEESSVHITALEGGGFMATYLDLELIAGVPPRFDTDIVMQVYDSNGLSIRTATVENGASQLFPQHVNPDVASLSDASSIVVWEDSNEDVLARFVTPSTGFVSAPVTIFNGGTGAGESIRGLSVTALLGSQSYIVAWGNENGGTDDTVQFRTVSPLGALGPILTVDATLSENADPVVTALTGGGFVISWTSGTSPDTGVRAQMFLADGTDATGLLTPATTSAGNQIESTVVAMGDGGFVVIWCDEDTSDLHGQRYTSTGAKNGIEFNIDTNGPVHNPDAVLLEDGRIAISWTRQSGDDDVRIAIWDSRDTANAPDSNGFQIGTPDLDVIRATAASRTIAGGAGADSIEVNAAFTDLLVRIDGGAGSDELRLLAESGTWDFRGGQTVTNIEQVEFDASNGGHIRTARFDAADLTSLQLLDFDRNNGQVETFEVYLGTQTTLNYSAVTVEDMNIGIDRIRIFGDGSVETITGTESGDDINAGAGNDTVYGGGGDDTINGGTGSDSLFGGGGANTLSYNNSSIGVTINLETNSATTGGDPGPTIDTDTISSFVHVFGGSGIDLLTGSAADNILSGNGNLDILSGGAGIDTLYGGAGDDFLTIEIENFSGASEVFDGGTGLDTVLVRNGSSGVAPVTVDLRGQTLSSIERIEFQYSEGDLRIQIYASQFGLGVATNLVLNGFAQPDINETFQVFADGLTTVDLSNFQFEDWISDETDFDQVQIEGGFENNNLTGTTQRDLIDGSLGNDTIYGGDGIDTLQGGSENDVIYGGIGDDLLQGGNGNDILQGDAGDDTLEGGANDDDYLVDSIGDVIVEGAGDGLFDMVFVSTSYVLQAGIHVEWMFTTNTSGLTAINMTGNELCQSVIGNDGNNVLSDGGGAGADNLTGANGNDTYIVRNAGTEIDEIANDGIDRVSAGVTFALAADDHVEELTTTSSSGLVVMDLTGNALTQSIFGNDANNVLNTGNGAADILYGNGGNDTYRVYNAADTIVEVAGDGTADRVASAVDFVLAADDDIEVMTTNGSTGTSGIDLTGNALVQDITGNDGINILSDGGGAGADILRGRLGSDHYIIRNAGTTVVEVAGQGTDRVSVGVSFVLAADDDVETFTTTSSTGVTAINMTGNAITQTITGNDGANRIDSGLGNDVVSGRGGADTFVFTTALGAGNIDEITDFDVAADTIELENAVFSSLSAGTLTAAAFRFNATGLAEDASDRITYDSATGNLYFDADGNGATARVQFAELDAGLVLTNVDFLVV